MNTVNYGKDWNYAHTRLRDSVVLHDGSAFYVHGVGARGLVEGFELISRTPKHTNLKELDLQPMQLGYVNVGGIAQYSSRIPTRRYRQGLTRENYCPSVTPRTKCSYESRFTALTIENNFPSIPECFEFLSCNEAKELAFSRNFALKGDDDKLGLLFRERLVGSATFNHEANRANFQLIPNFQFLEQMLEESIKNAN